MADTPAVTISLNNTRLSGLPIICSAKATKIRQDSTFRRIILNVTVSRLDTNEQASFEFSQPVDFEVVSGESRPRQQNFDISSAVRAMADNYEPTPSQPGTTYSYPSFRLAILSKEEYMVDGTVYTASGQSIPITDSIWMGTLSDLDRLYSQWPEYWSRKPTSSPQLVFIGAHFVVAGRATNDGISWTEPHVTSVAVGPGGGTVGGYLPVYGITKPADGYQLRFKNSLGVHEDVFVICLKTVEVNVSTDKYIVARQETLTEFSRGLVVKKNNHERWKLSSGPLNQAWQQYFLHEVLMAKWVWMYISSKWVPCHILPEDTVQGVDRVKASVMDVQFTVEFDINGSPF